MMQNANILLIEDDPQYHVLIPDLLSGDGHTIEVAQTVADARAYIARIAGGEAVCHAAIMDFHLNGGDPMREGETTSVVLADIREQLGPDFPVIGFSGASMEVHGIDGLYADPTKDGVFDLGDIINSIPDAPTSR